MEPFEYSALWWLPNMSRQEIGGTIAYSTEKGLELKLNGSFKDLDEMNHTSEYPVILGMSNEVKEISLIDCYESGFSVSFPGYATQRLRPQKALIGRHIEDFNSEKYSNLVLRYSFLAEWAGLSGFIEKHEIDKGKGLREWSLSYQPPEEIDCTIDLGELSVASSFHQKRTDLFGDYVVGQSVFLRVKFNEPMKYEDIHRCAIEPLQALLTLAIGRPNSVSLIKLYRNKDFEDETPKHQGIDVVYNQIVSDSQSDQRPDSSEMLFTLKDVKDGLGSYIDSWLKTYKELDSVCHLFFGVYYAPPTYLEERFTDLVSASETYHRRRFGNEVIRKDEHKERIGLIIESIPHEHRKWLKQQLSFSNEPSLQERMIELISLASPSLAKLVKHETKIARRIVDTRNYLTHHDVSLKKKAATGIELHDLTELVSAILKTCFLREMGFSTQRRAEFISRDKDFKHSEDRLAESLNKAS